MRYRCIIGIVMTGVLRMTGATPHDVQASIMQYQGGKEAAVSYTFDDGLLEHYTLVLGELNKRGLRGTFGVNGSLMGTATAKRTCMSWGQLKEIADSGHEVSNHGWAHKNLTKLSGEERRFEVQHNDTAIFRHTGTFPRTYMYPGNRKDSAAVAFASVGRVGTRLRQVDIGSRRDTAWLSHWLDSLVQHRQWGIGMTHGITTGYDAFGQPDVFWQHLDDVVRRSDRLWVATLREVFAYQTEREHTRLDIAWEADGTLRIVPRTPLDGELYDVPLTLLLTHLSPGQVREVRQGGKALPVVQHAEGVMVDFLPSGGAITIYRTMDGQP